MDFDLRARTGTCAKCGAAGARLLENHEQVWNRTAGRYETDPVLVKIACDSCGGAEGGEVARLNGR